MKCYAAIALLGSLWACDAGPGDLLDESELEDGIHDFRSRVVREGAPRVLGCTPSASQYAPEQCADAPMQRGPFDTTTVVAIDEAASMFAAHAEPIRFYATGADPMVIATDQPLHSSYGFALTVRPLDESVPFEMKIEDTSVRFRSMNILPAAGFAEGQVFGVCQGFSCPTYRFEEDELEAIGGREDVLEYELVFIPVWNFWDFDEGDYDITFNVSDYRDL